MFEKLISPFKRKQEAYKEAGLVPCGVNEEGEEEFIGTNKQWQEAENLAEETERECDCHYSPESGCQCEKCNL